jgi:hypothetical protein
VLNKPSSQRLTITGPLGSADNNATMPLLFATTRSISTGIPAEIGLVAASTTASILTSITIILTILTILATQIMKH